MLFRVCHGEIRERERERERETAGICLKKKEGEAQNAISQLLSQRTVSMASHACTTTHTTRTCSSNHTRESSNQGIRSKSSPCQVLFLPSLLASASGADMHAGDGIGFVSPSLIAGSILLLTHVLISAE